MWKLNLEFPFHFVFVRSYSLKRPLAEKERRSAEELETYDFVALLSITVVYCAVYNDKKLSPGEKHMKVK